MKKKIRITLQIFLIVLFFVKSIISWDVFDNFFIKIILNINFVILIVEILCLKTIKNFFIKNIKSLSFLILISFGLFLFKFYLLSIENVYYNFQKLNIIFIVWWIILFTLIILKFIPIIGQMMNDDENETIFFNYCESNENIINLKTQIIDKIKNQNYIFKKNIFYNIEWKVVSLKSNILIEAKQANTPPSYLFLKK